MKRNKCSKVRFNLILGRMKSGISEPMVAFVSIKRCLCWLPSRIPDHSVIIDEIVTSVRICRDIIVTVTGQAQKFGIFIEAVSACGIRDEGKEVFISQIVDPRIRRLRIGDYIFFVCIIEVSEFIMFILLYSSFSNPWNTFVSGKELQYARNANPKITRNTRNIALGANT